VYKELDIGRESKKLDGKGIREDEGFHYSN